MPASLTKWVVFAFDSWTKSPDFDRRSVAVHLQKNPVIITDFDVDIRLFPGAISIYYPLYSVGVAEEIADSLNCSVEDGCDIGEWRWRGPSMDERTCSEIEAGARNT